MTDPKAAAERLRRNEYIYEASTVNYNFSQKRMSDVCELADAHLAYLAECPADGETEIDIHDGWLEKVGFKWDAFCRCFVLSQLTLWTSSMAWEWYGMPIQSPKTRQDVRDLCRVLGVSLKEGA